MSRRAALVLTLAVVAAMAAAPLWAAPFTITLLDYIGIAALVVLGIVLLTGVGGMTSFGQAAFVGIAAYATAWLTTAEGASPWLGLLFALALSGLVAALLGAVTLRLSGHFLPLGTIAWGIAIYYVFGNMDALGRNNGLSGVPPIAIGSLSLEPTAAIYYLIWGLLAVAMLAIANLLESREGRAIRSLRGGTVLVESLGINAFRVKLITFIVAALLAAVAGWLYAHMIRFVSPAPFDVRTGIQYLFMAILGGSGHILGAVVGAALLTLITNALQDILPRFAKNGEQLQVIVFCVIYVLASAVRARRRHAVRAALSAAPAAAEDRRGRAAAAAHDAGAGHAAPESRAGAQALRRARSRQQGRLRGQGARDRRPDRPERRRQDRRCSI